MDIFHHLKNHHNLFQFMNKEHMNKLHKNFHILMMS